MYSIQFALNLIRSARLLIIVKQLIVIVLIHIIHSFCDDETLWYCHLTLVMNLVLIGTTNGGVI